VKPTVNMHMVTGVGARLRSVATGSRPGFAGFQREVAQLMLGSAAGRFIAAAALPVITRLFAPSDFQVFGVYMAVVTTVAIAACLRLEILLPLAKSEPEASDLFMLSMLAATAVCLGMTALVCGWPDGVSRALGVSSDSRWLPLLPVGVFGAAVYSACKYWATRHRRFRSVAVSRVTQATAAAAVGVVAGLLGAGPVGLILSGIVNLVAGCGRFLSDMLASDRLSFGQPSARRLQQTLCAHRRHAFFSTVESLANVAGAQLPVLAVAAWSGAEAGHLAVAMQILVLPMALLGTGVGQVYLSRAAEARANGQLAALTVDSMRPLVVAGIAPILVAGLVAPVIVPVVLGAPWARTGEMLLVMAPWTAMQIVVSPVSMAIYVTSHQRLMLALTLFGCILRLGATIAVAWLGFPEWMVATLAWASAVYYAVLLAVVLRITGTTWGEARSLGRPLAFAALLLCVVVGRGIVGSVSSP
jgi:O-antigen/teichoic acid export membrane protein